MKHSTSKISHFVRYVGATVAALVCLAAAACWAAAPIPAPDKPTALLCNSLTEPLGIDSVHPLLSWQLRDQRRGAKQTAYEILIGSKLPVSGAVTADVWDSGRIASEQSVDVLYGGPSLAPTKRLYWQVKVWDAEGKPYPVSDVSWFETGLGEKAAWKATWIGFEEPEQQAIRHGGAIWITNAAVKESTATGDTRHEFRIGFTVLKAVKRAVLYSAGQDTVAAWVNGTKVRDAEPLAPWKQMGWKTYVPKDVTAAVRTGQNSLAMEATHYDVATGRPAPVETQTAMSATLFVLMQDGTTQLVTSGASGWKAAFNAAAGWNAVGFDDSSWQSAERYVAAGGPMSDPNPGDPVPTGPVVLLRKTFEESKSIASARLYATALGAYKFHINGKIVGDQILSPGWMDFREHVPYQVYDVTADIKTGKNAIATYLAPGWYSTPLMWFRQSNNYGDTPPAVKAQLRIEHGDGSVEWISTDDTWKADVSQILTAEIYDGETYDARRVQAGWDTAGFGDGKWAMAQSVNPLEPEIVSQYFQPIREEKVVTAKSISSPSAGVYIFDFGQNMSGVERLHVKGKSGEDIKLRFAEVLNPDGTMYVDNLRTAKATDHYIAAGSGIEEYQPQFTYHGYRYLEVTGLATKPDLETVKTVVFHTDAPFTTKFETGDSMVNKLWSNILWGQRSNFIGVPTDCPQRDERLGWTADAQVFWRTAAYNMDLNNFTRKFSADLRGTQVGTAMYGIFAPGTSSPNPGFGPGWSDAGVVIPWTGWIQSGNKQIIDENWDGMEKYLAAILEKNPNYLDQKAYGIPFGDWLTPTATTPEDLLATAYWAYDATLMEQMARATGRSEKAAEYHALFEKIKAAFIKAYVRPDGFVGTVDNFPSIPPPTIAPVVEDPNKPRVVVETQTGYVLALHMNLLPTELRAAAAERLIKKIEDNHWLLGTGFLGTPYLLEVLTDTGHSDVAYRLLLNKEYPSWGYLIDHGATTTWERWNGDKMMGDPSMNSYNHYAYGAVAEWMYRYGAGVDASAADAGFHTIYLHPNFSAKLGSMTFSYDSAYGKISSSWKVDGTTASWNFTIPANATAELDVDATNASSMVVDGVTLSPGSKFYDSGANRYRFSAGSYTAKAALK